MPPVPRTTSGQCAAAQRVPVWWRRMDSSAIVGLAWLAALSAAPPVVAQVTWTKDRSAPHGRDLAAAVYDPTAGHTTMFGGWNRFSGSYSDETWQWDGAAWHLHTPLVRPSPRAGHMMAQNPFRSEAVLFGGRGAGGVNAETWIWDGAAWTPVATTVSPPARSGGALAFAGGNTFVLFGGLDAAGVRLGDTWWFSGRDWLQQTPTQAPSARDGHRMTFDERRGRPLLYGGESAAGYPSDLWTWDLGSWQLVSAAAAPGDRRNASLAFDARRGVAMLFGGLRIRNSRPVLLNDLWEWDGATWSQRTAGVAPSARENGVFVYDVRWQAAWMFGGEPHLASDLWRWDGGSWMEWSAGTPRARSGAALAVGWRTGNAVLFGGGSSATDLLADTWEWNGRWLRSSAVGPSARREAAMTGCNESAVLFGGWDGTTVSAETWVYELGQWRQGSAGPPGRRLHAMCGGSVQHAVIFGGVDQTGAYLDDAWIYDSYTGRWTSLASTLRPPARAEHALAADFARGRVVLFGGRNATGELGDTWEYGFYDGGWRQVTTSLAPQARSGHAMTYDLYRARVVLSGGSNQSQLFGDVWEYDGNGWVQRTTPSSPGARRSHALAFGRGSQVLLFGGEALAPAEGYVDTWTYGTTQPASAVAFGAGCARVPAMRVEAQPWLGGTFVAEILSADLGVALIGGSRTAWGSVPLPFDLGAIGWLGCSLYTSIDVTIPLRYQGFNRLAVQVPLPLQPRLVGQTLYLQNAVLRYGLPWGTTEALALVLGLR